jgi:hypothetical protein
MTAPTWCVQERTHSHREFRTYVDRLERDIAIETAQVLHHLHPDWQMRIVDEVTGELLHLGLDGKPLPTGAAS